MRPRAGEPGADRLAVQAPVEHRRAGRVLHVMNGDAAAEPLRQSGTPGSVCVWADVLHVGPVRADSGTEAWRRARARWIAQCGWASEEAALETFHRWDGALAEYARYEEVILWFEHDLFDQLLLIRQLEWFGRQSPGGTTLSLICVGAFPGVIAFHGLGQLTPAQLASLLPTRERITAEQLALGRSAWLAFTGDDPRAIERVRAADTSSLPFLDGALRRLLEEFPAVRSGLSRSERQILESLAPGPMDTGRLFRVCAEREERVFLGDASFWLQLQRLAGGDAPAVTLARRPPPPHGLPPGTATLTATGRRMLDGELDFALLHPLDAWIGGVHLRAPDRLWRWHEAEQRIVLPA